MQIKDNRSQEEPNVFRFEQLEKGWTVQGRDSGQIYFVVLDPGATDRKRLVNLNKQVLQNTNHCGGTYRRIFDAAIVLPPQPPQPKG